MVKIKIRDAIVDDVPGITKLYIDSVYTHFKGTLPDEELAMWTYESERRRFVNQIGKHLMKIRILQLGHRRLIGFTRFGADADDPEVGNIESLFVKDIYHKQGYGSPAISPAAPNRSRPCFYCHARRLLTRHAIRCNRRHGCLFLK